MRIDENISGRWVTEDEDSDLELTIEFLSGFPQISARCISDGEKITVTNLKIEKDVLAFDTLVPSSGYRAKSRMRFLSADVCEFELTTWEKWRRLTK